MLQIRTHKYNFFSQAGSTKVSITYYWYWYIFKIYQNSWQADNLVWIRNCFSFKNIIPYSNDLDHYNQIGYKQDFKKFYRRSTRFNITSVEPTWEKKLYLWVLIWSIEISNGLRNIQSAKKQKLYRLKISFHIPTEFVRQKLTKICPYEISMFPYRFL